jgi:rubrerythrin
MNETTKKNLQDSFAGESQAHMKYTAFSEVAQKQGKPNIARLFKAVAYAEKVHATNHLKLIMDINKTEDNLEGAIKGETFEIEQMYPGYLSQAQAEGEKQAERSIVFALEAEKIHAQMYKEAKSFADSGKDLEIGDIYICPVCGYTAKDSAPDKCPVCGVKKESFVKF